jgi:hypothetical protein
MKYTLKKVNGIYSVKAFVLHLATSQNINIIETCEKRALEIRQIAPAHLQ